MGAMPTWLAAIFWKKDLLFKAVLGKPIEGARPLCHQNYTKFLEAGGQAIPYEPGVALPLPTTGVIVDGLLVQDSIKPLREPMPA